MSSSEKMVGRDDSSLKGRGETTPSLQGKKTLCGLRNKGIR